MRKTIPASEAAKAIARPLNTVTRWLRGQHMFQQPLGIKIGGRWHVFEDILERVMDGSLEMKDPRVLRREGAGAAAAGEVL